MGLIIGIVIGLIVGGWVIYRLTKTYPDPDTVARQGWQFDDDTDE